MNTPAPKATILVVEDNEDVRDIVTICLRRNGYAIAEAADGEVALTIIDGVKPDLVLLDVLLPKIDGIEVLKKMRTLDSTAETPVVMMSAVIQTRDLKAETSRLNVCSFLQKPFQMRTLLEHVEVALHPNHPTTTDSVPPKTKSEPVAAQQRRQATRERRLVMKRRSFPPGGQIAQYPIPEILHLVFVGSQTGKLTFSSGTTEKQVFFQNGLPVYAESSIPEETLGAHMVRKGLLSQQEHNTALNEMTQSGRHFGEILLKLGLIGPHDLFCELEAHLTAKVISIFGWNGGQYLFREGHEWKDDVIVARMKPGRILLDGIQKFWPPSRIQEHIRVTDASRTFPLDASPYTEDQLGLSTQESRILQLVRRGQTIGEIIKQLGDVGLVTSTLYALYVMEYAGFVTGARPVSTTPIASKGTSQPDSERDPAKILLAEYLKYRTADYFKLLGVSRSATDEELKQAFEQRQRRYHPDTLIGIDRGLVHEKVEELYVRIHNAYRTLIDPKTRERYLAQLENRTETTHTNVASRTGRYVTLKSKPEHALLFEEGFSHLRSGDFVKARALFKEAIEHEPSARYRAYEAWTDYLVNPGEHQASAEKTLASLHAENPDEALFPYLLGNIALREKNVDRATAFFQKAVDIDPQHIESARQLRILRMRQKSSEVSGLFDLFKKDNR